VVEVFVVCVCPEPRSLGAPACSATRAGAACALPLAAMPRFWIWMQVLIVLFVFAGIVIAITKLA
jgi:hypothetical protein